jgi:hypothetical protein
MWWLDFICTPLTARSATSKLTVRFVVRDYGIREMKDAIARAVLTRFDEAAIEIASATYEIVGAPTLRVQTLDRS